MLFLEKGPLLSKILKSQNKLNFRYFKYLKYSIFRGKTLIKFNFKPLKFDDLVRTLKSSRLKCEISEHMFSHAHRPDLPSGYRKVITLNLNKNL